MAMISAQRMQEIQRASKWLRWFLVLLWVLAAIGMVQAIQHPPTPGARVLAGVTFKGAALSPKIETLWLLQAVLTMVLRLAIVMHVIRLLGLYADGKLFTAANVTQLRRIALTLLLIPAVWLIGLVAAAREIWAAQDQWVLIMPSFPGAALITGAVVLYGSWIMNQGRQLRDEQDLVI